jgi:hypothetical protein
VEAAIALHVWLISVPPGSDISPDLLKLRQPNNVLLGRHCPAIDHAQEFHGEDASLVVGWAQDAFVLPAAFGRRARGLPVWALSAAAIFFPAWSYARQSSG